MDLKLTHLNNHIRQNSPMNIKTLSSAPQNADCEIEPRSVKSKFLSAPATYEEAPI
jgi:hypothetical protein